jgi:hypothetical protein
VSVSHLSRPSIGTKPTSKSNHPPATPESTLAPATPAATPPPAAVPESSASIRSLAVEAIAQLDALEAKLNLDVVVRPNDKHQIRALKRVSDDALSLASTIAASSPSTLEAFSGIASAREYVGAMTPLANRVATLLTHLQKSIQNQRTPAAQKTLALYAVVKGLGRIETNETMRETVPLLRAEVVPKHKNPRVKMTKEQKAAKKLARSTADRVAKATAVPTADGAPVPTTTA